MGKTLIERLAAVPIVGTDYRPFSIAPYGDTVAFEWRSGGDWQLYTVDSRGAAPPQRLLCIDDPCGCPKYSADGRYLYFARDDQGSECFDFYRYELATGTVENLLADTPDLSPNPDLQLSPDGEALLFLRDDAGQTSLLHLELRTRELRDLSVGPGTHYHPRFTPDGGAVIVALSAPGIPSDLFRLDLADGRVTRLTRGLPDDLAGRDFAHGQHVHYRSLDLLAEVPALLFRPREHNGGGVVIIHGGPTWHHANEWDPLREAFLDAGFMVVHPNYRGSDGYGRRWQLASRYLCGQGEAQDCAGAHAFLLAMGCDPGRIAVTGRSHGGYLTAQMLTQFPGLWAAGVAGVPFFDHIDAQVDPAVREDLRWWDRENTGDLIKDRARLEYYSPINHLDRVSAPLLILAAARDPRCPTRLVGKVVDTLRAAGQVCEAHIYPDEGHEISGVENHVDYDRRTVEFILQHTGVSG